MNPIKKPSAQLLTTEPMEFNKEYWTRQYKSNKTIWDAKSITTPLKTYIDQLTNKQLRILIPGAGRAHEAEYLHKKGFTQVSLLDISPEPLLQFHKRVPDFPKSHLLEADFFKHAGTYDLILEQTFFCSIPLNRRTEYVQKTHELLAPNGKLVGLLFTRDFPKPGPPFGGSRESYLELFEPHFQIRVLAPAKNSIAPRAGSEHFIIFVRTPHQ